MASKLKIILGIVIPVIIIVLLISINLIFWSNPETTDIKNTNEITASYNNKIAAGCQDKDGDNFSNRGEVTVYKPEYSGYSITIGDSCVIEINNSELDCWTKEESSCYTQATSCDGDNCFVAEAVCDNSSQGSGFDIIKCVNGCNGGRCI